MGNNIFMRRFFYDPSIQETEEQILIIGSEAHHIKNVLRMQIGECAELFDGKGAVISGEITLIRSKEVVFQVVSRINVRDTGVPLTLAQAILKGKKMDLVVQKATELGVHTFFPVITSYCENSGKAVSQLKRWHRIMLEACKQCRRPIPMQICAPIALNELPCSEIRHKIMPWEKETDTSLPSLGLDNSQSMLLLIGPEGGFHPDEVAYAEELGFITVSLGPHILRAETAALVAVVLAQSWQ
ncbi:MAG: 16S rRNA (uracil(1498)-N(3))-methyltransferase [Candidatus Electrothrix sp. MAN1_4]|nr:16S rRNA (uracil(1498)-N(3))-methyltransferase [Candidatus Electrothrix sp. MAN1_4]